MQMTKCIIYASSLMLARLALIGKYHRCVMLLKMRNESVQDAVWLQTGL